FRVNEVIEKAVLVRGSLQCEAERGPNAIANFLCRVPASVVRDAQGGQAEARRGNTGDVVALAPVCRSPVFDLARDGAGLFPKEGKAGPFHLFQEGVLGRSESVLGGIGGKQCGWQRGHWWNRLRSMLLNMRRSALPIVEREGERERKLSGSLKPVTAGKGGSRQRG